MGDGLILYTTVGCHLCEEAALLLRVLGAEREVDVEEVDIATDEALVEAYGIRIPVIRRRRDGRELGWPFDLDGLRRFVSGNEGEAPG